jgi:hypothetical protein
MIDHATALRTIVARCLGGSLRAATPLGGGWSGAVYRVRVAGGDGEREVVIKLDRVRGAPAMDGEDADDRVYFARSWSLRPVHALLRRRGLPTYDLLAAGFPSAEVPYRWQVMSVLEGTLIKAGVDSGRVPAVEELHRVAGAALGALHAVTRDYDGPVDQRAPHRLGWGEAFFRSLERQARTALVLGNEALGRQEARLRAFIDGHRRSWVPPRTFALSHFDGLQAMAAWDGARWALSGYLDLEDYGFTDPRLPLAGYELGVVGRERRGRVPAAFWEGYRARASVDPGYEAARDLFWLYFLLEWFPGAYAPDGDDDAAARSENIRRFEQAITALLGGDDPRSSRSSGG